MDGSGDAPLLFRLRWDPALFDWSWRFLRECTPGRTRANIGDIVRLALYSRDELGILREETGIQNDHLSAHPARLYRPEGIRGGHRGVQDHARIRLVNVILSMPINASK